MSEFSERIEQIKNKYKKVPEAKKIIEEIIGIYNRLYYIRKKERPKEYLRIKKTYDKGSENKTFA